MDYAKVTAIIKAKANHSMFPLWVKKKKKKENDYVCLRLTYEILLTHFWTTGSLFFFNLNTATESMNW